MSYVTAARHAPISRLARDAFLPAWAPSAAPAGPDAIHPLPLPSPLPTEAAPSPTPQAVYCVLAVSMSQISLTELTEATLRRRPVADLRK